MFEKKDYLSLLLTAIQPRSIVATNGQGTLPHDQTSLYRGLIAAVHVSNSYI